MGGDSDERLHSTGTSHLVLPPVCLRGLQNEWFGIRSVSYCSRLGTTFNSWSMPNDSSPDLITHCSIDVYMFTKLDHRLISYTYNVVSPEHITGTPPLKNLEIAIFSYQEFKWHCVNKSPNEESTVVGFEPTTEWFEPCSLIIFENGVLRNLNTRTTTWP
jgi:hypothetical protein